MRPLKNNCPIFMLAPSAPVGVDVAKTKGRVHLLLKSNPAFARVCGFARKAKDGSEYHAQRL